MEYKESTAYLIEKGIEIEGNIFPIENSDNSETLNDFYQFCQINLKNDRELIGENVYFYYYWDTSINAFARRSVKGKTIAIHIGTAIGLKSRFDKLLNSENVTDFNIGAQVPEFLYSMVMLFVFYHEKAHLIQNKDELEYKFDEDNLIQENEVFSYCNHLMEYDADSYSVMFSMSQLKQDCENRKDSLEYTLEKAGLFCAGIYWFFMILLKGSTEVYIEKRIHPHPVVRIGYIIDRVVKYIIKNIDENVEQENILNYFISYVTIISKTENNAEIAIFAEMIQNRGDEIEEYTKRIYEDHKNLKNTAIKLDNRILEVG